MNVTTVRQLRTVDRRPPRPERSRPRRFARSQFLALCGLLLALQVVTAPEAFAVSCGAGKHIFVRNGGTSPSTRWGVRGKIEVPNHQFDPDCNAAAFATIHFNNCSSVCGTQVEIGLKHYAPTQIVIWTEREQNGVVTHNDNITTAGFNILIDLRLKVTQAGDVFFEYDFGNGWLTTWSSPYHINWAPAFAMGESEKLGDATQMTSSHRNLKFLNSGWNETNWGEMTCEVDEAPGWSWDPIGSSNNDYDVVNIGGGMCDPA
jgi:hypothetical protein